MDYTTSANSNTSSLGKRKHSSATTPTTRVSDKDINGPTFEIMAVIEWAVANGHLPNAAAFDAENPATYNQLLRSMQAMIPPPVNAPTLAVVDAHIAAAIAAIPPPIVGPTLAVIDARIAAAIAAIPAHVNLTPAQFFTTGGGAAYLAGNNIGSYMETNYAVTPSTLGYPGFWVNVSQSYQAGDTTMFGWIRTA